MGVEAREDVVIYADVILKRTDLTEAQKEELIIKFLKGGNLELKNNKLVQVFRVLAPFLTRQVE